MADSKLILERDQEPGIPSKCPTWIAVIKGYHLLLPRIFLAGKWITKGAVNPNRHSDIRRGSSKHLLNLLGLSEHTLPFSHGKCAIQWPWVHDSIIEQSSLLPALELVHPSKQERCIHWIITLYFSPHPREITVPLWVSMNLTILSIAHKKEAFSLKVK